MPKDKKNKGHVNIVSGNARVGVQRGGTNIRRNKHGAWDVDGVSVGSPEVQSCGCPGNPGVCYPAKGPRVCNRCQQPR